MTIDVRNASLTRKEVVTSRVSRSNRRSVKKVLLIDDHPIVLQGCRQLLEDAGAERVVEAQTLRDGLRLYKDQGPDAIVVDLTMGSAELGGLSFLQEVRRLDKRTPILVFTMHSDPIVVRRAMSMGATAYVLKDGPFDDLINALGEIREGRRYISRELVRGAGQQINPLDALTRRELETLALLANGMSYRKVARQLQISSSTVASACWRIKSKLGVQGVPDLMRLAIRYLPSSRLHPIHLLSGEWTGNAEARSRPPKADEME